MGFRDWEKLTFNGCVLWDFMVREEGQADIEGPETQAVVVEVDVTSVSPEHVQAKQKIHV